MSSQASGAGHGEAEVRRKLVETGDLDAMISIRSNFFYTRTVPCELWHFDKGKPANRRDQVLMIDARNIYRKVTRKIYDFTPEQLANLTAIVWLYRGQADRFLARVQSCLDRTLAEAAAIAGYASSFRKAYDELADAVVPYLNAAQPSPAVSRFPVPGGEEPGEVELRRLVKERDEAARACFQELDKWTARIAKDWKKSCPPKLTAQTKLLAELDTLATACRDLVKDVDLACKLAVRLADAIDAHLRPARNGTGQGRGEGQPQPDVRALRRLVKDLDAARVGCDER